MNMKTKFNGILTLFLALIVQISFAQQRTISGTVFDESGPLPGVSIIIKGSLNGTETNFDGNYSIRVNKGAILVFNYLGYKIVERKIENSNVVNVTLSVDANVLIFERIKEEYKLGRKIYDAIESGFEKAVSTIIDANLTTLFAAIALFSFGSGPIKGFSVTLMIGILTSMFTAIIITKYLVLFYVKKKDINKIFY